VQNRNRKKKKLYSAMPFDSIYPVFSCAAIGISCQDDAIQLPDNMQLW
jgi:hypothetical protein